MTNLFPFTAGLMATQSADETTSPAVDCQGYPFLGGYVTGAGVTSSGVITFEEAPTADFAGAWSPIGTINASDVTNGGAKALAFTARGYAWVRARISTAIGGGGTISAYLTGSPSA